MILYLRTSARPEKGLLPFNHLLLSRSPKARLKEVYNMSEFDGGIKD